MSTRSPAAPLTPSRRFVSLCAMFCPSCKDEFRLGFTRCDSCNAALIEELPTRGKRPVEAPPLSSAVLARLVDYCGFLSLEEARGARDRLRSEGIRSEIAIREDLGSNLDGALQEEYWLRVEQSAFPRATDLLGFDAADAAEHAGEGGESSFSCGDCGREVAASETFCPHCGARFDES